MPFFALSGNIIMISFLLLMLVVPLKQVGLFLGFSSGEQNIKKATAVDHVSAIDGRISFSEEGTVAVFNEHDGRDESSFDKSDSFASFLFEPHLSFASYKQPIVFSTVFVGLYHALDFTSELSRRGPPAVSML